MCGQGPNLGADAGQPPEEFEGLASGLAFCTPPQQGLGRSRPLCIEFPGAIDHVTSRGDRREPIDRGDTDRLVHLAVLEQALEGFDAEVLA